MQNPLFFMQNDDWVYYINVENFINGNFNLHPLTAPTFYTQGFLGYIFSILFGIQSLPLLTLLIVALSVIIFVQIINKNINNKLIITIICLLFFTSPLYAYSSIGFMTDAYILFFILLYIYIFNKFKNEQNKQNFLILMFITIAGYFTKQVMLIMPISTFLFFLLDKKFKVATKFLIIPIAFYLISQFVIPQTPEMIEKQIIFNNLLKPKLIFEIFYTVNFYLTTLIFPLILVLYVQRLKSSPNKIYVLTLSIFFAIIAYYLALNLSFFSKDFPFVENTFTRKGFFPGNIDGNKYHMIGFYDIFNTYQVLGYISIGMLISSYLYKKSIYNLYFISYLGLMFIAPKIYDRYYIPLILFGLLEILSLINWNKIQKIILFSSIPFLIATTFITYQFYMDFITTQAHIWKLDLPNTARSRAYNNYYEINSTKSEYFISYDKGENNSDSIKLDFPFSFFVDPIIYINKN